MQTPQTTRLIPIGEAAKMLGVSLRTLRRWDADGYLVAVRPRGGQRRYRLADIEAVISGRRPTERKAS